MKELYAYKYNMTADKKYKLEALRTQDGIGNPVLTIKEVIDRAIDKEYEEMVKCTKSKNSIKI